MNRAILTVSAASLTVLLSAFGPPELPSEKSQQAPLKTWIPEPKAKDPIIAAPDLPQAPSPTSSPVPQPPKMTHMPTGMVCANDADSNRPQQAAKEFVEAYSAAKRALIEARLEDVLRNVEAAAQHAKSGQEWSTLELMRLNALLGLNDKASALALIDQLSVNGSCLSPAELDRLKGMRRGLRRDLGLPPG